MLFSSTHETFRETKSDRHINYSHKHSIDLCFGCAMHIWSFDSPVFYTAGNDAHLIELELSGIIRLTYSIEREKCTILEFPTQSSRSFAIFYATISIEYFPKVYSLIFPIFPFNFLERKSCQHAK